MLELILLSVAKVMGIVMVFVMAVAALLTWIERKQSALIQNRVGPNRASVAGLRLGGIFHLAADAVKMLTKEDFDPETDNPLMFRLAPFLAVVPVMLLFAVIPFGPGEHFLISNVGVGALFILAVSSLGVYGSTIGAWASNNNFAMLGSIRTTAQMISYEVSMGLNLVGIFMIYESVNLQDIVIEQGSLIWGWLPAWGIVLQPLAFILFMTASIAETKRAPFDLPEGESEIVGYFVEFSSMRFGLLALSEFIGIVAVGATAAVLFLGGWQIPWVQGTGGWLTVAQVGAMILKTLFVVWLQMAIRWTLPRFRYDQLMRLGWQYLLPLSLLNIFITGVVLMFVEQGRI
ncbi:MAG: NADH-quinone oxidoreductase subunit H [Myxococcales bacterium]|nr:NADH-quinone oxidoreductase subunit H [Myxococcales bacterium]